MRPMRLRKLEIPRPTQTEVERHYGVATDSSERVRKSMEELICRMIQSMEELICRMIHRISVLAYGAHQQAPYLLSGSGRMLAH
jgi:hypothetical protein